MTIVNEEVIYPSMIIRSQAEAIELLEKENKQLKEQVQDLKADYGTIAQIERDLYKEIIEEVREYIEDWLFDAGGNGASMTYEDINELLQILDKVKD